MQGTSDASSSGNRTNNPRNRTMMPQQQQQQQQQQHHSLFSNDGMVLLKRALQVATTVAVQQQQQQQQQQNRGASTTTIVYPKKRGNGTALGAGACDGGGGGGGDDNSSQSSGAEGDVARQQQDDDDDESSSSSTFSTLDGFEKDGAGEGVDDEGQTSEKIRGEDLQSQGMQSSETPIPTSGRSVFQKRNNKLPTPTMDKRQRDLQIRKHIESLVCTRLPLSLQNDQEQQQQETTQEQPQELRLASALLPKECRQHSAHENDDDDHDQAVVVGLAVAQARYFLSLAENNNLPWVVLFLRSGRFSGAIFQKGACIQHRNLQRYTVRKGQGKAQSAQDASGRRPKSMGAQLRRAGEEALKSDVTETLSNWKLELQRAAVILISCPKTMRKTLYDCMENSSVMIQRNDDRIRRVPLDLGRPTFENCVMIHDVLATITVAAAAAQNTPTTTSTNAASRTTNDTTRGNQEGVENENHASPTSAIPLVKKEEVLEIPLEAIHLAAKSGNLAAIQDLLAAAEQDENDDDDDDEARTKKSDSNNESGGGDGGVDAMVNRVAGLDLMTPLHFAAALTTNLPLLDQQQQQSMQEAGDTNSSGDVVVDAAEVAAECVMELLIRGKANPAKLDARGRPPYFLASHEKVREAFRMARAQLAEDYCKWDEDAKVGPPLTVDDLTARKEKEAEKKKKKKTRQKEKKAKEKALQEEMEKRRQEEQEKEKQQQEARRVRDGLAPKNNAATGNNVCDFCQTVCKGRQRSQMFRRLDYNYCTTECLQKHKRELMAAAALARFNNG